jgi:hypothetical protein
VVLVAGASRGIGPAAARWFAGPAWTPLERAACPATAPGAVSWTKRDAPCPCRREGSARTVTIVEREGEPLAAIIHDRSLLDEPSLVRAASAAARLAIDNERLQAEVRAKPAEVQASRARIVEAGDAERHRVERNLHDGAQQRLVTLSLAVGLLKEQPLGPRTPHWQGSEGPCGPDSWPTGNSPTNKSLPRCSCRRPLHRLLNRPTPPRPRPRRADRRVLGASGDLDLRRAADRPGVRRIA